MRTNLIRSVAPVGLFLAASPMLAADSPIVDPPVRAGTWIATASDIQIGGKLPPGATEAVTETVSRSRIVCLDLRAPRGERKRNLLEAFAGAACTAERAAVDGQKFSGKLVCGDDNTTGSTSYEGSFDATNADVDLTVDMAFKETDWRMLLTSRIKFEWQREGC